MHKYILIFLCSIFLACSDKQDLPTDYSLEKATIEELINQGIFLKSVEKDNEYHLMIFESGIVKINSHSISNIESNKNDWSTTVTFIDDKQLRIPTIGTSLNKFIINTTINSSGFNPLAANVKLNYPYLGRTKIIVHSKEKANTPDVEHIFKNIEKVQSIDILGLYQDFKNKVTIIYTDLQGNERARSVIEIKTEKLNLDYLPTRLTVKTLRINEMEPGFNLVSSPGESEADTSIPYMVDMDGEIRWVLDWKKSTILKNIGAQCGISPMKNGNYIIGDANNHLLAEINHLGEIVNKWDLKALGYTFHHEICESDNGNFLVTVTKNDAKLINNSNVRINDHIIEFDPIKGIVTKEWDLVQMLDSSRYIASDPNLPGAAFGQSASNWLHNNAILSDGEDFIGNARFQGVFKFSRQGALKWIISAHKNWSDPYRKYLLQPLNKYGEPITDKEIVDGIKSSDVFEWPWGGHNPVLMPNGHILVFDNGYGRNFELRDFTGQNLYSRIVEYEVDEKNMTVRQIWQYGKERRKECYAPAMSGVQYLKSTGNKLFCPGMGNELSNGKHGARIIELSNKNNEVVFELEIEVKSTSAFHRAVRAPLYRK